MEDYLVPMCVKLTRRPNGEIDWPDFNAKVSVTARRGKKWSHFIDDPGTGWIYDKIENLGLGDSFGQAMTLVPIEFAKEAALAFPDKVTLCTEVEWELFHDTRATAHIPAETVDVQALQGLLARIQLGKELNIVSTQSVPAQTEEFYTRAINALNPSHSEPGVHDNLDKKLWKVKKSKRKIEIHPEFAYSETFTETLTDD